MTLIAAIPGYRKMNGAEAVANPILLRPCRSSGPDPISITPSFFFPQGFAARASFLMRGVRLGAFDPAI